MTDVSTYFSRGQRPGRFNLGNVVLVNLLGKEYFLGFIQDVDRDRDMVFVDFDCNTIAPWWVPADRVVDYLPFPHHPDRYYVMDYVKKIVIPTDSLRYATIDEYRISRMLDMGFRNGRRFNSELCPDRLFVEIESNAIRILIWNIACMHFTENGYGFDNCPTDGGCFHKNTEKRITAGVEKYLFGYCGKPELCLQFSKSLAANDRVFETLPPELLSEALHSLDLRSQVIAKRVCALWNLLLPDPSTAKCIHIDFASLTRQWTWCNETEGYHIGQLVHRCVHPATHALAISNLFHRCADQDHYPTAAVVTQVLRMKGTLPLIVLKDIRVPAARRFPRDSDNPDDPNLSGMIFYALQFTEVCRRVVIRNYTVDFAQYSGPHFRHPMPGFTQTKESFCLMIPIPSMILTNIHSKAEKLRCLQDFKMTLEALCPPVKPAVKIWWENLHAKWVRKVPFPGLPWTELRQLLCFYGPHVSRQQFVDWNARDLGDATLGNLQLAMLARHYGALSAGT
ncbi:uncharacterized protein LOC129598788 isoform X2 [Paramacrobiotus metropolitanus]|uniref:uncharacterized protein LOC129598788 isoform X2 n=1 Tax=Paramacrobiotus metropolitanus TaxID=2943436 RepID=UPI002445FD7B|nr:uncharacterized protein LOC129598788 isoform X2 [Paramacrobiotus metropolitanus]